MMFDPTNLTPHRFVDPRDYADPAEALQLEDEAGVVVTRGALWAIAVLGGGMLLIGLVMTVFGL